MSIDINVHITADEALTNALSSLAGCLAVAIVKSGKEPVSKEAVYVPQANTPAEKTEIKKVKSEKPVEVPAKKDDAKEKRDALKTLAAKVSAAGKSDEVKAILQELGVTKLSQIPEDKLDDALKRVGELDA